VAQFTAPGVGTEVQGADSLDHPTVPAALEDAYREAVMALDRQGNDVGSAAMFLHGAYSDAVAAMRTVRAFNGEERYVQRAIDALVGYESHLTKWRTEVIHTAARGLEFTDSARELLLASGAKRCAALTDVEDDRECGRLYLGDGLLCVYHAELDADKREADALDRERDDAAATTAYYGGS